MVRWRDRADRLLYDGESIRAEVDVEPAGVVVTTHRVLAFTPEREGANYRAVERPNVGGARATVEGSDGALATGVKALVIAVVLLGAGQVLNLEGLVEGVQLDGAATGQLGMGGMLSTLETVLGLLAVLDDVLTLLGGLALLVVAGALAWYARSRERLVRLPVAGGDDLLLPAPGSDVDAVVERLDDAVGPDEAIGDEAVGDGTDASDDADVADPSADPPDGTGA